MPFVPDLDWSAQAVVDASMNGATRKELKLIERIAELERTLKALRASYEERGEVIRVITQSSFD